MLKMRKIGMICFLGLCIVMTGGWNGKNEKEGMDATQSQAEEMTTTDTEDESQLDFANNYKQYEKFGMKYNENDNRFYYDGKLVRKFKDKKDAEGNINGFSFADGEVDITARRDESGQLIGLEKSSEEDFQKNTEDLKSTQNLGDTQSFEEGNEDLPDETLKDYQEYGVSYNKEKKLWQYDGKDIYIFYDPDGYKMIQGNVKSTDGVSLKVIRNSQGKIDNVKTMKNDEINLYAKELLD